MGDISREIGLWGEHLAQRCLRRRGYMIIATNVRVAGGEIDIVAREKPPHVLWRLLQLWCRGEKGIWEILSNFSREIHTYHYIEVKTTVARENAFDPAQYFDQRKAARFERAVEMDVLERGVCLYRLHVVFVVIDLTDKTAHCSLETFRVRN